MTRYRRLCNRKKESRRKARMKAEGWLSHSIWMHKDTKEQIRARAKQLDMPVHTIITAALLAGLRTVSTTEIVKMQLRWREKVKPLSECYFKKDDPRRPDMKEVTRKRLDAMREREVAI